MHARRKKLRELMQQYKVNAPTVAKILNREPNTVRVWRCSEDKLIPENELRLLELELTAKASV